MTADQPGRVPPGTARRTSRNVAKALLAASGSMVAVRRPDLTEDVDGRPLGVDLVVETGVLHVTPEALGWTADQLGAEP